MQKYLYWCLTFFLWFTAVGYSQTQEFFWQEYLPQNVTYDPQIPTPESVLRHSLGEWHARPDQIVAYLEMLAQKSNRIHLELYGETYEKRPLLLLTISSPENLAKKEELRQQHLQLSHPESGPPEVSRQPIVVYLGYSVHGNESSGANAALLVAYYLTAARGEAMDQFLAQTIILLDPCLNPDGLGRFAHWANMHKGQVLMSDPNHREHVEPWPTGRTNHYWFDLNRDWLFMQHPESQGRMAQFHRWKPNIVADFHEMGTNATYFFQPGVPARKNPLTPEANQILTQEIAQFHAKALDQVGQLYFSQETFDDFFYGKGSTYPDLQGSIGILFEQASSRGHLQDSIYGPLSFPQTIRNQFLTSLSTLKAAEQMRQKLLEYQYHFFKTALVEAQQDPIQAYVFETKNDSARFHHFLEILHRNQIHVYSLRESLTLQETTFPTGSAYLVPVCQPQYRLIKSLFETPTTFPENIFYDISAWTLPYAFNFPFQSVPLEQFSEKLLGPVVTSSWWPQELPTFSENTYAFLLEWKGYYAPRALNRLLQEDIKVFVATQNFSVEIAKQIISFEPGTLIVPIGIQKEKRSVLEKIFATITQQDQVQIRSLTTGLTPYGIDLGSPSMRLIPKVKPVLILGSKISTYEAGEVWHLLDYRFQIGVTCIEWTQLNTLALENYTHLIFVNGSYDNPSEDLKKRLQTWVRSGGTLITQQNAVFWAEKIFFPPPETAVSEEKPTGERRPYASFNQQYAERLVSGIIVQVYLDITHPLGYGYTRPLLPVFREATFTLTPPVSLFETVAQYTENPLLTGYISSENLQHLRNSPAVCARKYGKGAVIQIADNLNFRAFWYGTNKLFLNSLFFSPILQETILPK